MSFAVRGADLARTRSSEDEAAGKDVPAEGRIALPSNAGKRSAPRIFFLFMAENNLPNIAIWSRFFAKAKAGVDFEVFIHCEDKSLCEKNLQSLNHTYTFIDTVESHWCTDLVTPMNALLSAALRSGPGHVNDKFAFISDTTVPVKSFSAVQHKLLVQDAGKSNFCVQEWPKWAWFKGSRVLAKHSQWLVLNRAHAEKAIDAQEQLRPSHLMRQMSPLTWLGMHWYPRLLWRMREFALRATHNPVVDMAFALVVPAVRGCADEFWHLAVVTGALEPIEAKHGISYKSLAGGPLTMNPKASELLQGTCDTYAVIDSDTSELTRGLQGNGTTLGGSWGFLRPHIHAGKFKVLSESTLKTLGSSNYLFARKMDATTKYEANSSLVDAFDTLIFSQP